MQSSQLRLRRDLEGAEPARESMPREHSLVRSEMQSSEPEFQRASPPSHWLSAVILGLVVSSVVGASAYFLGLLVTAIGLAGILGLLVFFGIKVTNDVLEF